jgi:ADP-ribose pyrophosphatase YjhB (NUDIX family)
MNEVKKYNVTFLTDSVPPQKILLLKRASTKDYAPGYFTGIGGKIGDLQGYENESPLESAYRELKEETLGAITKENVKLKEFARCIYPDGLTIYYFHGIFNSSKTIKIDPEDGELVWSTTSDLLNEKIIPTTLAVCKEWKKRNFKTDSPFTVFLEHTGMDGSVRLVTVIKVEEGLL